MDLSALFDQTLEKFDSMLKSAKQRTPQEYVEFKNKLKVMCD